MSTAAIAAPLKIGQTGQWSDLEMIGTVNGLLNQKLHGEFETNGGTIKRISENKFLLCGWFADLKDPKSGPTGYVVIHDRASNEVEVDAPISYAEQEAEGCWAEDRAALAAAQATAKKSKAKKK